MNHLIAVDGSGYVHRAFHVANPVFREKDGQPIGATLSFAAMLWRLLGTAQTDKPTHGVVVFDAPGKNFRHRLDPTYKANRPAARRVELADQIPLMKHVSETLGFKVMEVPEVEADDTLATLAVRAKKAGMRTTVVSADKDLTQIIEDGWIEIYDTYQRKRILASDTETKMGVPPKMVPHLLALWGDSVDNIIGVDGVGRDKAARLVRRFGGTEDVLAAAKDVRWPPVRAQLMKRAVQERVRLNLKLATLRRNVKLPIEPADLVLEPVMRSHLTEILRVLGAPHYMEAIFALDPQMSRQVPHEADPEAWWREELKKPGQTAPEAPQAGYYFRRLVSGGPLVAARIWREPALDPETGQSSGMDTVRCTIGEKVFDPFAMWPSLAGRPIKKSEYDFMEAKASHAKVWTPSAPAANPTKKIVLSEQPVSRNPRPIRRRSE